MLAIKVEYLTGVYMATRHNDPSRSTPEWPPHPDRLYSALVAAADPEHCDSECAAALRWLAKQGPCQLAVSKAQRREAPEVHMPTNPHEDEIWQKPKKGKPRATKNTFDLKTLLPTYRKKAALPIPAVIPDDPIVHFIWPAAEPDPSVLTTLRTICERVTYLGRCRSLVRVSLSVDPPPLTFVPDSLGQVQLRVPGPDRLGYLIDKYKRDGGKPAPSPTRRYRCVGAEDGKSPLPSVFGRVWIFQLQGADSPLPIDATVKVTRTLRAALIRCIEDSGHSVPDVVHGHGEHPHCAYVGLPFVDARLRYADGCIKGVAILIPRTTADDAILKIAAGLERLQHNGLHLEGIGSWYLKNVLADDPPLETLRALNWTRPSRAWTTVTPMVFGHYPKPKNGGEPGVIKESLRLIGIPPDNLVEIAVSQYSSLHGAPASQCFRNVEPSRHIRHVSLCFRHAVPGPILLGSMRYFGLGLMRPVEE